jgi:plastocyanin
MRTVTCCLFRLLCAGLAAVEISRPALAATSVVQMVNFRFQPQILTIHVGDTVLWTNTTSTFHTTTSSNGLWDSGLFSRPGTFAVTFPNAGSYGYFCTPHRNSGMVAIISHTSHETPTGRSAGILSALRVRLPKAGNMSALRPSRCEISGLGVSERQKVPPTSPIQGPRRCAAGMTTNQSCRGPRSEPPAPSLRVVQAEPALWARRSTLPTRDPQGRTT